MKKRIFLKYLVALVSGVLFAGCSNNMQSVSPVSDAPNTVAELKSAVAADAVPLVRDMGYSFRCLWVVTKTPHGSDFLLAKYDFFNSVWVTVNDHWGVRCAVSLNSKCYHVNAAGELWWVDNGGAYQKINTPYKWGQRMKALDIGAAYGNGYDELWVLLQDRYGFRYVYAADYPLSGAEASNWVKKNESYQGRPERISVDPLYPSFGMGVNTRNEVIFWDPDGHNETATPFIDVAMSGPGHQAQHWIAIKNSTLYKGSYPHSLYSTGIAAKSSVSMTEIAGTPIALYIDNSDHLNIDVWDDIPILP